MPTEPIYFGNDQKSGDHELAGASPLAVNVITDGAGAVRRRPGISAWDGFPASAEEDSAIEGMHAFEGSLYYVNANRHIYRVAPDTATSTDMSTGGGTSYLAGSSRPVFAETQFRLLIAGGGALEKIDSGDTVAERVGTGATAPPICSHVVALASRVLVNDLTSATTRGRIAYSGVGSASNEVFDALNFVTAEARPDSIEGLFGNSNELFAFGERSLQVFTPDASTILQPQRALSNGCAAGYSIIEGDGVFHWLDDRRRLVSGDGRSAEEISATIAKTLDGIDVVSDCFGFRWIADQYDVLTWVFPSDGRTFAAQAGGGWAQWHGWTTGNGYTLFPAKSHFFWPEQNVHLVGLEDGTIAKLDTDAHDDLGGIIKAEARTGFVSHDTSAYKHCESIRFFFRRGHAASGAAAAQVLLSWRDTLGDFCTPIRMNLGVQADYVFTVEKRSLGTYRSRQWKLEFTDAVDFVLARCEETFTVGTN